MIPIKPKKGLGQHFLHDKNIARKIVKNFQPQRDDIVVEIGPGSGILTGLLTDKVKQIYLIEKDKRAIDYLHEQYKNEPSITILHQDFLDTDLYKLSSNENQKLRVIGNIPYYITTPILFHIIDNRECIIDAMLTMQLEVARRIIATPGTSDYGILSVLSQTWALPALLFKISPKVFFPPPSVDSAVIHLEFNGLGKKILDEQFYRSIVRGVFGTRRKMLRTSLRKMFLDINFSQTITDIDLRRRPEQLTIDEFISLSNYLFEVSHHHER